MSILNNSVKIEELYPFYFIVDKNFQFIELGEGYKEYLQPSLGDDLHDYFNCPCGENITCTTDISELYLDKRIALTDKNNILFKGVLRGIKIIN